jgi:hypothetical protein
LDKKLSEGLSKIGNNSKQHAIGDEVFWGIPEFFVFVHQDNKVMVICAGKQSDGRALGL